jgi:IPT/TIG domain-containing protein
MKTLSVLLLAMLCVGCGSYKAPTQMAPQPGIVPVIAALSPTSVTAGTPGLTLTVNGNNFNSNSVVNWNGAPQMTAHVTGNQVTAAIPAADVATAGMVAVTVTNPGSSTPGGPYGGGGTTASETSASMTFTIK